MIRLSIAVSDIDLVLLKYNQVKIYYDSSEEGAFTTELTTVSTRIDLIPEKTVYEFYDETGDTNRWYKTAYFNEDGPVEGNKSGARQGGVDASKVGWTFENYAPPNGEWGEVYTADDMRYTMLFGIDCVGNDIARSEFTDAQFKQIVNEAVSEFESFLTMDIRKKIYKCNPDPSLKRGRIWRDGVDYTDIDDTYPFDSQTWGHYGHIRLRHFPLISVERCILNSPLQAEVMDLIASNWVRVNRVKGSINLFPNKGYNFGPYAVQGMPWTLLHGRYPQGFEIDYTTGYESAEFVPDGLRSTIAKYATIKALAVVGDGLMAGFSSQSVSLDGLSESFSSTQSATSAFFGARIAQYAKEIDSWLKVNRYKFAPIPLSFTGS